MYEITYLCFHTSLKLLVKDVWPIHGNAEASFKTPKAIHSFIFLRSDAQNINLHIHNLDAVKLSLSGYFATFHGKILTRPCYFYNNFKGGFAMY